MNKTLRIARRAGRTYAVHAGMLAAVGGAGGAETLGVPTLPLLAISLAAPTSQKGEPKPLEPIGFRNSLSDATFPMGLGELFPNTVTLMPVQGISLMLEPFPPDPRVSVKLI